MKDPEGNDGVVDATAVVEAGATVGAGCRIGPFCHVHRDAVLGPHCVLETGVVVYGGSVLGEGVRVYPHAVIGGDPQFVGWDRTTVSGVRVGARTVLREGVTVHRSIYPATDTEIGDDGYVMAFAHIGHDCRVGDRVVIANGCQLAGHVEIGNAAFLGGGALFHQFVRVGCGVMVAGGAIVTKDIAPYLLVADRNRIAGLNQVGLRRSGLSADALADLKACYRAILRAPGNPTTLATALIDRPDFGMTGPGRAFIEFLIQPSKRGIAKDRPQTAD